MQRLEGVRVSRYALARILLFFPTLWGLLTLVFFLNRAMPGDPVEIMLGENAAPARRVEMRHALGLDRPLAVQYGDYLAGLATGRLGRSLRTGRPVSAELADAFPRTLELGCCAMLLACLVAVPLGTAASRRPGGPWDATARFISSAGFSLPSFFLGPLLILAFAVKYPWLPVSGADEPGSIVLPSLALGLPLAALLVRIVRTSVGEEAHREYVRAALARGLREGTAFRRHALRNALLPVVTVAGLQFGAVLTGAIITEKIFRWPGLGTLVLTAITGRDYPVVQGAVLLFAVTVLTVNLGTDLLYARIDPRVRYA